MTGRSTTTTFILKGQWRQIHRTITGKDYGGRATYDIVPDGSETYDVELVIDLEQLAQALGRDAIRNTSRRAKLAHGLIVAKAINIKKEPQP